MIDVKELVKGDTFYQCCEYHWKVKYEFVQLLKDGRIKVKNTEDVGMYRKGEVEYLNESDLKYCFIDNSSTLQYQRDCKNKVRSKSRDELLKDIYNKADSAGIFTDEESKLYKSLIYK